MVDEPEVEVLPGQPRPELNEETRRNWLREWEKIRQNLRYAFQSPVETEGVEAPAVSYEHCGKMIDAS